MLNQINVKELEEAVNYLASNISKNKLENIKNEDIKELVNNNLSLGIQIRDILRKGGFYREEAILDELWSALLIQAAKIN